MTVFPERRRFTVGEYYHMAKVGILEEDDRVELIDGQVLRRTPIGPRHAACVTRLDRSFQRLVGDSAIVRAQNPVQLGEYDEPEPDLALLRPRADCYAAGHPTPEDVLLTIEVGETSSRFDRRVKVPRYGRHGIPESWLADLDREAITVYRDPTATGYRAVQTMRRGETLTPLAFPDLRIAVDEILG